MHGTLHEQRQVDQVHNLVAIVPECSICLYAIFKNGRLNLKPWILREPIHKFKRFNFKSPSSCDIKDEYWGEAAPKVMTSGWSVGQCCAMPEDGISAYDWEVQLPYIYNMGKSKISNCWLHQNLYCQGSTSPDKTIPTTIAIVDVNSLPTINANMNSHSSSKPFNSESSSFTPFWGPPHMIPPPPNIVQFNPGYSQHLVHPQAVFLQPNCMQIYILRHGTALSHCSTQSDDLRCSFTQILIFYITRWEAFKVEPFKFVNWHPQDSRFWVFKILSR